MFLSIFLAFSGSTLAMVYIVGLHFIDNWKVRWLAIMVSVRMGGLVVGMYLGATWVHIYICKSVKIDCTLAPIMG